MHTFQHNAGQCVVMVTDMGHVLCRRTVRDRLTNQKVVLSDKDVQLIQRFRRGKTVDPSTDPYAVSLVLMSNIYA